MKFPFWPDFSGYRNIELGLSRVHKLLERLDNPHLKIPPTIHLAGTNGKGSTLSFLKAIFTENGYKVHTYTSPHLVNFNERIVLSGEEISDSFLTEILNECQKAAEKSPAIPVTFFEGITVAAFLAFSRIEADILILETGLGGRLDATNVLPKVLCSIITPIAFDHTDFLGKSLSKIAFEKGGIIKNNCPVIIAKQKKSALKVLEEQASKSKSETKIFGNDWKIKKQKNGFLFEMFGQKISFPTPSLTGEHQIENASAAIAAALTQKEFPITEDKIKSALKKASWPARLQKIESGKFFKMIPENCELYLDGSHNLQGSGTLKKFFNLNKNKKIFVIFSMLQDKDCAGFLQKIASETDVLIALTIPNEAKSRKAKEIVKIAQDCRIKAQEAHDFSQAFAQVTQLIKKGEPSLIVVCGSLYLAGSFLDQNLSNDVV